jgi:hypothetical protein
MTATQETLTDLLNDLKNYKTRAAAREKLQNMDKSIAPQLLEELQKPDMPDNYYWALMRVLTEMNHQEACPVLLAFLKDNIGLRGEAAMCLQTMTGEDYGENYSDWYQHVYGERPEGEANNEEEDNSSISVEPHSRTMDDWHEFCRSAMIQDAEDVSLEEDYIHMRIKLGDRHQQLLAHFKDEQDEGGRPAVMLYTQAGIFPDEQIQAQIPDLQEQIEIGELSLEQQDENSYALCLRHYMALDLLMEATLQDAAKKLAAAADSLEKELTDSDRI